MPTEPNCGMGGSTLTVGELRNILDGMDDSLPVTLDIDTGWWLNLWDASGEEHCCSTCGAAIWWKAEAGTWESASDSTVSGYTPTCDEGGSHRPPSLIMGTTDDFDPRQF